MRTPGTEYRVLTSMETVDEGLVLELFLQAARGVKEKADHLQDKLTAD